jgi:uncharacterized membrane protein
MKTNSSRWNRTATGMTLAAASVAAGVAISRRRRPQDTREALAGPRGIHVKESVTIARPARELYDFWRSIENLPRFMSHLESVTDLGDGRSHWVAKAPLGSRVEWDAEVINEVPDRVIGWRSLPGSTVTSAGSVTFEELPGRGTRVRVHLQYDPPAGKIGGAVARLFGKSPAQEIREDLQTFKSLLEAGEVPTTAGQPRGNLQS